MAAFATAANGMASTTDANASNIRAKAAELLDANMYAALDKIYNDPKHAGSFGSAERLLKAARQLTRGRTTLKQVQQYLLSLPEYGLHRMQIKTFARRKVISYGINWLWELDLADMRKYKEQNSGVEYLLVKIDVFSKFANVEPMIHKTGDSALKAFKSIVDKLGVPPKNLYTDRGAEFFNIKFQDYLSEMNINHYGSYDDATGAPTAERFIRTIKGRIYRYMSSRKQPPYRRYIDVLPDLVHGYNASVHRSIGMAPADVRPEHTNLIRDRLYPQDSLCSTTTSGKQPASNSFKMGDIVRKQIHYTEFHKGFTPDQYTKDTFKIDQVLSSSPVTYKLCANNAEGLPKINGIYYRQQLLLVLPAPKPIEPPRPKPGLLEREAELEMDVPEEEDDNDDEQQPEPEPDIPITPMKPVVSSTTATPEPEPEDTVPVPKHKVMAKAKPKRKLKHIVKAKRKPKARVDTNDPMAMYIEPTNRSRWLTFRDPIEPRLDAEAGDDNDNGRP